MKPEQQTRQLMAGMIRNKGQNNQSIMGSPLRTKQNEEKNM